VQRPAFIDGVFEATSLRFLRRIHRITHRMPMRLREVEHRRALVIAPHPDDEAIAVGGNLALHQRAGSDTLVLYVTLDQPGKDGTNVRKVEAERVARLLGFNYRFLGFPDGYVSLHEPSVANAIEVAIRTFRPDVIYCPFPGDHHRDHMSVSACTSAAATQSGYQGEVWCYEVWSNLWPNTGVDITTVVETKRRAIACYQSQLAYVPYDDGAIGLNRFRGLRLGVSYVEGLFVCPARTFVDLCRALSTV
jgi:N-acetylglucosamine malate deacetylase 1